MQTRIPVERQDVVLRLLRQRNEKGMRLLFEHYAGALMAIIQPVVGKGEVAEEVLQDVLLRIWKKVDTYDADKSRFFTWMARIARNAAIDKTRSKEYKASRRTNPLEDSVSNSSAYSVVVPTDGIGVATLLGKLDDNHRRLLELLYLRDYTQSEAAKKLGIPLGTVKTRARRAIRLLRDLLSNEIRSAAFVILLTDLFQNL